MKSTKFVYALILFALMLSRVVAKVENSFDMFPLGCYSYLVYTDHPDDLTMQQKSERCAMMREMGYNFTNVVFHGDAGMTDILKTLKDNRLNVIMEDRYYYPYIGHREHLNFSHYSSHPLSTSSYLKFEAEYSDIMLSKRS